MPGPAVGVVAVPLAVALAGCGGAPAPTDSGAHGTVLLGPTCPVERDPPDPACADRPYATDLRATEAAGAVTSFRSGEDGTFRVALPPGTYVIHGAGEGAGPPTCTSPEFEVLAGAYTEVAVGCDSGIR